MAGLLELERGDVFARDYRVIRPLGKGGMGAVYEAEQLSTGAQRALKLMLPQLVQDQALRKRFEQEARVCARIKSDHVVQVVAAGVDDESGMPWIAMELLEGEPLGAWVKREGGLSLEDVDEVMRQLVHAVGAAHRVGVVHRDLKPDNIFIANAQRAGVPFTVKVLDFGIAKVTAEAQTSTTAAIGTPLWMAPEQTQAGAAIQPTTDVWTVGLIAFYVLTGRHYWRGAAADRTPMMLLREVCFEPLASASERAAELRVADKLPPGFDAWFEQCVVRDTSRRFADASEAGEAFAELMAARLGRERPRSVPPPRSEALPGSARSRSTRPPPVPSAAPIPLSVPRTPAPRPADLAPPRMPPPPPSFSAKANTQPAVTTTPLPRMGGAAEPARPGRGWRKKVLVGLMAAWAVGLLGSQLLPMLRTLASAPAGPGLPNEDNAEEGASVGHGGRAEAPVASVAPSEPTPAETASAAPPAESEPALVSGPATPLATSSMTGVVRETSAGAEPQKPPFGAAAAASSRPAAPAGSASAAPSASASASLAPTESLSPAQIGAVVEANRPAVVQGCMKGALSEEPISTRVSVVIVIGPSGAVESASARGGDAVPGLASCVEGRVRAWRFPASNASSTVNVAFTFEAK